MSIVSGMTSDPFAKFDLEQAMGLRWTLRDIRGKRWKLSQMSPSGVGRLVGLG